MNPGGITQTVNYAMHNAIERNAWSETIGNALNLASKFGVNGT